MIVAAFFAVLTHPLSFYESAVVDVCELNHIVGDDGSVTFTQVILWRWYSRYPEEAGHHVSQWFACSSEPVLSMKGNRTIVRFRSNWGKCFEVSARTFRETRTAYDPEALDRDVWPISARRPYFDEAQKWGN